MKKAAIVTIPAFLHHQQLVVAGISLQAISYNNIDILLKQNTTKKI